MNKCPHNQQIRIFCIKPNCQYPTVGGCNRCFNTQHIHQIQQIIQIDQVNKLMSRYSFPNKVKPQCINLQQSFYTFFKKTQNQLKQIIATIDQICKNVVNTIGFPYISFKNNFNVYKRIKNKQFNRVSTAEFQKFINQTKSIPLLKLAELEEKLYLKEVNTCHEMIKQIDHMLAAFQNVTRYYQQKVKFIHDNSAYIQNKQIVQKIKAHFKPHTIKTQTNQPQNIQNIKSKKSVNQQTNLKMSLPGLQKCSQSFQFKKSAQSSRSTFISKVNQQKPNQINNMKRSNLVLQIKKNRQRQSSIDNRLMGNKEKLQQKLSNLRKNQRVQTEFDNNQSQQISKQKLKNINLPAEEDKTKNEKNNQQFQIRPITRKLQQKLYEQKQINQISSPLLKKKFKKDKRQSQEKDRNLQSPNILSSPQANQTKVAKINNFEMKVQKVKESLPQLLQYQEKSFVILIASLKLQASQAIPMVQKALEHCNKNLSAAQYLSFLYLQSNQFQKCLKICQTYLNMISNTKGLTQSKTLLINNKASALNNLGRYSQTVKLLQNYNYPNELILKNIANAYFGLGFLDQAINIYRKLLTTCYDDEAYYNLSSCLYLINQFNQAKQAIDAALTLQPQNKDYLQLQMHIINASLRINNTHKN